MTNSSGYFSSMIMATLLTQVDYLALVLFPLFRCPFFKTFEIHV